MDPLLIITTALAIVVSIPLGLSVFNVIAWRRGRADGRMPGSVSVLIPARNEAQNIEACLAAAQASRHPILEILVYDDASTDETAARVEAIASRDSRVRLIRGAELPRGWAGKSHACHRLAEAARGEILAFIDADVRLQPTGLCRLGSEYEDLGADLVSAIPRQETVTWFEQLILPLLHLTYTSWLPLPLIHCHRDPRFLAVNGQVLSIRRSVYEAVGGFETVRNDVVEDMAFCRLAKRLGFRVAFADGHCIARCRMYRSTAEVWEGFSKNLYRGLGARLTSLLGVFGLYLAAFVIPYAVAIAIFTGTSAGVIESTPSIEALLTVAVAGVAANIALRALLAWRYDQTWWGVVTHPFAVLALVAIGINSFIWHQRGTIRWRGRIYGGRAGGLPTTTAPPAH